MRAGGSTSAGKLVSCGYDGIQVRELALATIAIGDVREGIRRKGRQPFAFECRGNVAALHRTSHRQPPRKYQQESGYRPKSAKQPREIRSTADPDKLFCCTAHPTISIILSQSPSPRLRLRGGSFVSSMLPDIFL